MIQQGSVREIMRGSATAAAGQSWCAVTGRPLFAPLSVLVMYCATGALRSLAFSHQTSCLHPLRANTTAVVGHTVLPKDRLQGRPTTSWLVSCQSERPQPRDLSRWLTWLTQCSQVGLGYESTPSHRIRPMSDVNFYGGQRQTGERQGVELGFKSAGSGAVRVEFRIDLGLVSLDCGGHSPTGHDAQPL